MAAPVVVQGVFDPKVGKVVDPWAVGKGTGGGTAYSRAQAMQFARQLLESSSYREWLKDQITTRTLPTDMQKMLWAYAYGKPTEHVNLTVSTTEDLSAMTIEELQQRAQDVAATLEEAKALEAALPATVVVKP